MKSPLKVVSAGFLAAAVALTATFAASAAGINSAEQSILDELNTTVTMQGVEKKIPASYINQAENYFNTIEVTDEQAKEIVAAIEDAKSYLEGTGAANFKSLTSDQVDTFVAKCQSAVSVIDLTLSFDKSSGAISLKDSNNNVVFSATTASFTEPGKPGGSGKDNPIKTTGAFFNIPGIFTVAGVGVLLVSATGVYLVKKSKKESFADANA